MFEIIKHFIILTWTELLDWIRLNNNSVKGYILKVFIAIFIYIVISDCIKKLFKKIQDKMEARNSSKIVTRIGIYIPMYMILSCIIITLFDHLNKIEVSPEVTLVVFLFVFLLLAIKGFFTKLISKLIRTIKHLARGDDEDVYGNLTQINVPKVIKAGTLRHLINFTAKLIGVTIATFVIYFSYQAIIYMMETGGEEISYILDKPDDYIVRELDTSFEDDLKLADKMPIYTSGRVSVKTDGELNIIYLNNRRIGFNTTGRKYNIYGVSINQTEIGLRHRMTYIFDESLHTIGNAYGGKSNITYYHNLETNSCLVVIVSATSNRVVSVSYFTDFDAVTEGLMLTTD